MTIKIIFVILSAIFLLYLLLPGPSDIKDFAPLPNSFKSEDPGDTTQIANVSGYFSDNYRDFVTNFYKNEFERKNMIPLPSLRLNYPPEQAFLYIKDQTLSTYLEEYVYPLRGSLFINGFEPVLMDGSPRFPGGAEFGVIVNGGRQQFKTKTIIRFYPSPLWVRLSVWLGINVSLILIWKFLKSNKKYA